VSHRDPELSEDDVADYLNKIFYDHGDDPSNGPSNDRSEGSRNGPSVDHSNGASVPLPWDERTDDQKAATPWSEPEIPKTNTLAGTGTKSSF
jgi:hypothetical protein